MPKIIIKQSDYIYKNLKRQFFEIVDALHKNIIKKDSLVLIKPNLLSPFTPEKAIITHPLVVKAAAEYVLEKGGRPQISDSPAIGSFEKILGISGIKSDLEGLGVELKEFKKSVKVDIGKPFGEIDIAEDVFKADVIINLPKLKTHTHMLLTLGVKNLFGCVVGMKKPEWHFKAGVNREFFAKLLVLLYKAISPQITIIDGILAMEGQGPGKRGTPRHLGILIGSNSGIALDNFVCKMLGIPPDSLLTNRIAKDLGLIDGDTEVLGDIPKVKDFKLPAITPLVFGPRMLHGYMRRHLVQRPVCDKKLCTLCAKCKKYCPANAISFKNKKISFDYDKCIRCYCCIEICPQGALYAKETNTGKIFRNLLKISE